MDCVLTLEIPKLGRNPVAIVATTDRAALIAFKRSVLAGYANAIKRSDNQIERIFRQSQFEHLERVLDIVIPELDA